MPRLPQGIHCVDFSLNRIEQNMADQRWYLNGFQSRTPFFYLLEWKTPRAKNKILKFGYKLSVNDFRKCYAQIHHQVPSKSIIWKLSNFEKYQYHSNTLEKSLKSLEQNIHRDFKRLLKFKTYEDHLEFYREYSLDDVLEYLESNLHLYTLSNVFNYQLNLRNIELAKYCKNSWKSNVKEYLAASIRHS